MCADIDRTVGLASIELRDFVRNALGLKTVKQVGLKSRYGHVSRTVVWAPSV